MSSFVTNAQYHTSHLSRPSIRVITNIGYIRRFEASSTRQQQHHADYRLFAFDCLLHFGHLASGDTITKQHQVLFEETRTSQSTRQGPHRKATTRRQGTEQSETGAGAAAQDASRNRRSGRHIRGFQGEWRSGRVPLEQ
jgi:hypothetical protein